LAGTRGKNANKMQEAQKTDPKKNGPEPPIKNSR